MPRKNSLITRCSFYCKTLRIMHIMKLLTFSKYYARKKYIKDIQLFLIRNLLRLMNVSRYRNKDIIISSSDEHLTRTRRNYFNSCIVLLPFFISSKCYSDSNRFLHVITCLLKRFMLYTWHKEKFNDRNFCIRPH